MAKRVAIIGAGASGLTAIKCCLDEGLDPVCFERTGDIGGLWNFTKEVQEGQACVMKSTVINTSKEMMCYSDFPIPKEYPIFMHNTYVQKYFRLYAEKFDLLKYIHFNTEIQHVQKHVDFATSGQWDLKVKNGETDTCEDHVFDAVLLCTGHHAEKNVPTFPGLEKFKGKVIHSHDYRDIKGYEDKRIVIIGIGNSGGDAAVELSRVASQVFLSTRRGTWILNRVAERGEPIDMMNTKRSYFHLGKTVLGIGLVEKILERNLNARFDHALYSLQPSYGALAQHPMVNDDLPNRIVCGAVQIKPDIEEFTETGVKFKNGTFEDNIDVVFLATGYIFGFPYLDKSAIDVKENRVNLFKYMFPPDLEKPTLAVIGCVQPLGAIMPISELQCRLAALVFKGDVTLPSREDMWLDIRMKEKEMSERYVKSQRHTIQVDFISFMDELAELVGCKPNTWSLMKTDPRLAIECFFGPCTPYQYRLCGKNTWAGAREAIFNQWDRTHFPLKSRPLDFKPKKSLLGLLLFFCLIVIVFAVILQLFM